MIETSVALHLLIYPHCPHPLPPTTLITKLVRYIYHPTSPPQDLEPSFPRHSTVS